MPTACTIVVNAKAITNQFKNNLITKFQGSDD